VAIIITQDMGVGGLDTLYSTQKWHIIPQTSAGLHVDLVVDFVRSSLGVRRNVGMCVRLDSTVIED
jgi:hypothetical protein